jgi:acyl-lipid omega-6 desaturase (Delta-12 desaturase)
MRRVDRVRKARRPDMTSVEEARTWAQILGPYGTPKISRSVFELLITAVPFVLLWGLMWAALGVGYWLCLLLALPTACFLMRLFMIQPHCGHGACFKRRATNDWVGRVTGVVTLTPYSFWLRGHALHPANAGNLDHRGSGEIMTLTTDEYLVLRSLHRLIYRLYRNPFVMFGFDSDLSLRAAPTSSFRLDALGKRALAQHNGNQRGDRRRRFFY